MSKYSIRTKDNVKYQMWNNEGDYNVPPGQIQYKITTDDIIGIDVDGFRESCVDPTEDGYMLEPEQGTAVPMQPPALVREGSEGIDAVGANRRFPPQEHLLRLTPDTKTGNATQWTVIMVWKKIKPNGGICYKGALRNTTTNEIALITAINTVAVSTYNHNMVNSHDPEYKICRCKMIAPLCFWDELNARMLY
jgi:hypothetical protein